ncbi:MAG TPA: CoA ester lyase [Gemmatimonadaceae bacterium]|nr:CoA ester lyase [Gemmatimonadaceae bacterium]
MPPIVPRLSRSMLFVPASRPDMVAKAARSEADAVCLDLEDAVAPDQKEASRALVVEALTTLDFGARTRIVRVNALDTMYTYRDVIEVVEGAGAHLDLLMLPKAGGAADVQFVDRLLTQLETRCGIPHRIGIEAQVETALGFLNLQELAASSPRLESLIFGMGDYAASMQMPLANIGVEDEHDAAYGAHRWHAVMHGIVAAARAYGLRCMDGPVATYQDEAALARACWVARAMGFDGKQCIHPVQLAAVNAAFCPTEAEVARARDVVARYEASVAEGHGAVGAGGIMIDAANLRMARVTLRAAEPQARGGEEAGR